MQKQMELITSEILEKISPTPIDRSKMEFLARSLERKVSSACKELGVKAVVRVEGSLAKDTWLKGDPDIDVFMRLPPSIPRKELAEISLRIARRATEGAEQIERFAEHPYLEAFIDGVRVNVVPCYESKPGEWLSATDRTPYHTDYINKNLDIPLRNDVRLLKKFMKGIGVYGAEIKIGGFSGYLCELLVLHFGSFAKVLDAIARHKSRRVIDIEGYYYQRPHEVDLLFSESLVIIDPVDRARNVAAAVQLQKLHVFAAASRSFLMDPNKEFFEPLKVNPLSVDDLREAIKARGTELVFLTFDKIESVPDVLWGQLHRTRKALRKQLELAHFNVLRDNVWTQEKTSTTIFVFELEQRKLSATSTHLGPPLEFTSECDNFLKKYSSSQTVVSGPYIDQGRWMVEIRRKCTDADEFLRAKVHWGGRDVGIADSIAKAIRENHLVLVGEEITEHYIYNEGFSEFLTNFLSGKPFWLELKQNKK